MCNPAFVAFMASPAGMAVTTGMSVLQWYQGEQQAQEGRKSTRNALVVQQHAQASKKTDQQLAAEIERDKFRRKSRVSMGQMQAIGASRGLAGANAMVQVDNEYEARENEYIGAVEMKRGQQDIANSIEGSANLATYYGRMKQYKGTGAAGLAMAVAGGVMQHQMAYGQSAQAAGQAAFTQGAKFGASGAPQVWNQMVPGLNNLAGYGTSQLGLGFKAGSSIFGPYPL